MFTVAVITYHSVSYLTKVLWVQQLNPESLPARSPLHRFGWNDEGDALELHRHCLSWPEEAPPPPPHGEKEGSSPPRTPGGNSGAGKSKMCCAKARSNPKVLSAVLGDVLPHILFVQAYRPALAITEPTKSHVQDATGEGSEF